MRYNDQDLWLKLPSEDRDPFLPLIGVNATGRWILSVGDYSPNHTGRCTSGILGGHEKLSPELAYPVPGRDYSKEPGLIIPDDTDSQTISSTISVPHGGHCRQYTCRQTYPTRTGET